MTKYVIKQTRFWFGPRETKSLVMNYNTNRALIFDTRERAEEHIEYLDAELYYRADGESSRPDYTALKLSDLPEYIRQYL